MAQVDGVGFTCRIGLYLCLWLGWIGRAWFVFAFFFFPLFLFFLFWLPIFSHVDKFPRHQAASDYIPRNEGGEEQKNEDEENKKEIFMLKGKSLLHCLLAILYVSVCSYCDRDGAIYHNVSDISTISKSTTHHPSNALIIPAEHNPPRKTRPLQPCLNQMLHSRDIPILPAYPPYL